MEQVVKTYHWLQTKGSLDNIQPTEYLPIQVREDTEIVGFGLVDGDPAVVLCYTNPIDFLLLEPVGRDTKLAFVIADRFSSPLIVGIREPKPLEYRWLRVDLIIEHDTLNGRFYDHLTVLYINNNMREKIIDVTDSEFIHDIPHRVSDRMVRNTHHNIGLLILDFLLVTKNRLVPGYKGAFSDPFVVDDLALVYCNYHQDGKYIYVLDQF